ncbi:unnamed protein product [Allacma fusca]|uniref:Uncharacterized protein n=1 Tax=Allacma fusca TaxID=39272 RepID=A0A8J2P7J9_9HEXA|nr:unnamed protein product [Allacma fusca]
MKLTIGPDPAAVDINFHFFETLAYGVDPESRLTIRIQRLLKIMVISLIIVDISHGVSSGRDRILTTKKNMEIKRIHASGPIRQETVFAARGPRHPTPIRVIDASSKIRTIRMASPECGKGMSQSMATPIPGTKINVIIQNCPGQPLNTKAVIDEVPVLGKKTTPELSNLGLPSSRQKRSFHQQW